MVYEAAIKAAIEAAPVTDDVLSLADVSERHPSIITVNTTEELTALLMDTGVVADNTDVINEEYSAGTARHEGQHAQACRAIGGLGIHFGIRFFRREEDLRFQFAAFISVSYPNESLLSNLALASVATHPTDPSKQDLEQALGWGYEGVDEVAERAMAHNRTHINKIPIPLSYDGPPDRRIWRPEFLVRR